VTRPAHVLLVESTGYEDLGGAAMVINELIDRVDRGRYIPVLACLSPGRWPELVRARGTAAYSFPLSRLRSPQNLLSVVLKLRDVVRRHGIDLIHASENSALLYASLAGRLTRTPVVWHIHSTLQAHSVAERAAALALRRLPPAHIVFTSPGTQRNTMPFPGVPASVVFPGVDLDQCRSGNSTRGRGELGIPDDALVVSMFARVVPVKGQADFVECVGRLTARHPELYGVMCGPGDQTGTYWRRLEELRARYGLCERLLMPGDVRPPRKHDIVAGSDVVLHPSHAEPFGLSVLEAMAAGKPVVAADTDGPRLLIDDGVDGMLVPPGDIEHLAAAVRGLLDDPPRRAALGSAAARSAERFQVQDMVRRVEELWDEVLENGARG
jgi:glycosyltransferase involved in cell wall biosynthesis